VATAVFAPKLNGQTMKKFSTAAAVFALASTFAASAAFAAEEPAQDVASKDAPATDAPKTTAKKAQRRTGLPVKPVRRCEFKPNAPDKHLVVRGDTLWDISGKFLEQPWCWPQVWGINQEQIRDPHWIYPGQIVYFDRVAGRLRLGSPAGNGGITTVKLSPRERIEAMGPEAIPAIPAGAIEPFLTQPLIVEADELLSAPRIVAAQEGHVFLGKGDKAYVRGDLKNDTSFQVFRPAKPLIDPGTKEVLGYEAAYLGAVSLTRPAGSTDEVHSFVVSTSKEEMGVGDQLAALPPTPMMNYVPHPPETQVDARIVSIYSGVTQAGQNQVVTVNRGKKHGLDVGSVLELYRYGQVIADRTDDNKPVKLPDEKYGSLFIFRTFNNVSYGLIMQVTDAAYVGDVAKSPE
jgi:hypothetical protein